MDIGGMMERSTGTIKAIMFDLGNVLVFFDAKRSSQAFAKALNVSEDEIWEAFFISDLERAYTRGEISSEEFYRKMNERFPSKLDFAAFAHLWNDIFTENHDMNDLLTRLRKHYPLYLISNTNDLHFEYVRRKFSVLHHFVRCFPSHQVGHRKPDRMMFEHVLSEIKLRPEETIFIDDVPEFVASAQNLGICGVQFKSRAQLEEDLRRLGIRF